MLIKCPKCGFSQPKDRYCASCGIDMEAFKPKRQFSMKMIIGNTFVLSILIFATVFTGFYFLRKNYRAEISNRVEYLKGGPIVVQRSESTPPQSEPKIQDTSATLPSPPTNPTPVPINNNRANSAQVPERTRTPSADTITARIYYAEVDLNTMELLRQESASTGQIADFGEFKAGALPATRKVLRERGVRVLERINKTYNSQNLSHTWFVGKKALNSENDIGITSALVLEPMTQGQIRGEFEIMRSFHETNNLMEPPVKKSYPATQFELTPGMTWMMSFTLPTVAQDEDSSEGNGVMSIFQSNHYKSGQSEFTIFLEFDTPK